MPTPQTPRIHPKGISRRALLNASLAAGVAAWVQPRSHPPALWGAEAGLPKRGGILRLRGWAPPHFDPHLTLDPKTHNTLSFVYSKLVRYKVGAEIPPGTFLIEPDLAERWEAPDDTTYVFHLRHGVHWHNKSPVNGRELVAEDIKFTFDRFLTEQANPLRYIPTVSPLLTPVASRNLLLLQSLPTLISHRQDNVRRRKDVHRVGTAARGGRERLFRLPRRLPSDGGPSR